MNPIEKISAIAHKIPIVALEDINKRVTDWMASGGKETDPYIYQQLRYAENIMEYQEGESK